MKVQFVDESTKIKLEQLCERGYQEYENNRYASATRLFYQAWILLPKPQSVYWHAPLVLTAIGDSYFKQGNYQQAIEALLSALHCPSVEQDASNHGFIHTRLGQCQFQLRQEKDALNHFSKAQEIAPSQLDNLSTVYRHFINQ